MASAAIPVFLSAADPWSAPWHDHEQCLCVLASFRIGPCGRLCWAFPEWVPESAVDLPSDARVLPTLCQSCIESLACFLRITWGALPGALPELRSRHIFRSFTTLKSFCGSPVCLASQLRTLEHANDDSAPPHTPTQKKRPEDHAPVSEYVLARCVSSQIDGERRILLLQPLTHARSVFSYVTSTWAQVRDLCTTCWLGTIPILWNFFVPFSHVLFLERLRFSWRSLPVGPMFLLIFFHFIPHLFYHMLLFVPVNIRYLQTFIFRFIWRNVAVPSWDYKLTPPIILLLWFTFDIAQFFFLNTLNAPRSV